MKKAESSYGDMDEKYPIENFKYQFGNMHWRHAFGGI